MDRNDAILTEVLSDRRSINGFLESVFGFLYRHTDFYHLMKSDRETVGFPPGYKENLVLKILHQFEKSAKKTTPLPIPSENNREEQPPEPIEEIEIPYTNPISNDPITTPSSPKNEISNENTKFQSSEYYNGAIFEKYCWSQTISDIEIHIVLPDHITSSKQLNVKIDPLHINVFDKSKNEIILDGIMMRKCKHNDAVWSLTGRKLQITLDKVQETWWHQFLNTEPLIDLTKLDCTRAMDELPEETQAVIEQMKWDQQQKMLGLPTSAEITNQDMLKKAWDVEGSPFKGQPFDPTAVKFN